MIGWRATGEFHARKTGRENSSPLDRGYDESKAVERVANLPAVECHRYDDGPGVFNARKISGKVAIYASEQPSGYGSLRRKNDGVEFKSSGPAQVGAGCL
jgi:hypothetical protein